MFEIIIIALLAGSLDNLENQVDIGINELDAQNRYMKEMTGYLISHNVTIPHSVWGDDGEMNVYEFEAIVKEHMQICKAGIHDEMVSQFNNNTEMDEKMKKELLGQLGHCRGYIQENLFTIYLEVNSALTAV